MAFEINIGQATSAGGKPVNQDYYGFAIPQDNTRYLKGIVVALADGISSSQVSQHASQSAVEGFIADYYSTSETWSVEKSAIQVLTAMNAWLHAQTKKSDYRYDIEKGYVCTFSAIVFKSHLAHLFHVGDSRIYRYTDEHWEVLTHDHRLTVAANVSYLNRALGIDSHLDLDHCTLPVSQGDRFMLMSDGAYDYLDHASIKRVFAQTQGDLNLAAQSLVDLALANGSQDNVSLQIVDIEKLPQRDIQETFHDALTLPIHPPLDPPCDFEGYDILRELHANHRSHVYLAKIPNQSTRFVLKMPSIEQKQDALYMERFILEEWVAKRISHPHLIKAFQTEHPKRYFYTTMAFIEGQNLAQWFKDNPMPTLNKIRDIAQQLAKALEAFHRLEMIHQDIRPENIMIDQYGTVTLIDFGATYIKGVSELTAVEEQSVMLGTALYSAPEYFLGEVPTWRSDQFSLALVIYHLMSGRYPYGVQVPKTRTRAAQARLQYQSVLDDHRAIPQWLDEPLKRALHPDPYKRYDAFSEFIADLKTPSKSYLRRKKAPFIERDPVKFWKILSLALFILLIISLV